MGATKGREAGGIEREKRGTKDLKVDKSIALRAPRTQLGDCLSRAPAPALNSTARVAFYGPYSPPLVLFFSLLLYIHVYGFCRLSGWPRSGFARSHRKTGGREKNRRRRAAALRGIGKARPAGVCDLAIVRAGVLSRVEGYIVRSWAVSIVDYCNCFGSRFHCRRRCILASFVFISIG